MSDPVNSKMKVRRLPERGAYDRDTIYKTFDDGYLCHVGYESDHGPIVLPTLYGRSDDFVYFHGSPAAGMFRRAKAEVNVSLTVTHVDGFVLARSLFHHSMNYRSVVAIGTPEHVTDPEEINVALEVITENCLPGRWAEARKPNEIELKQTAVYRLSIADASVKIRTGGPGDDEEDIDLDIWAGVLPVVSGIGVPIPAPDFTSNVGLPAAITSFSQLPEGS
ncbi:MAG: pyridoxamine 5'-phosphate oxidase family protein [Chloroflexi bacterium]|nr:pyridoxamine 5'-phosphate oxidase family protein [Chloroflexota bacterium]